MGKTFVALAVAYSIATRNPRGPVIVMVPANLIGKWEQDLATFCELYLENRRPVRREGARREDLTALEAVRYGTARHSVDLMRLLDDPDPCRCHLILLAQGAMSRSQTDKWVRLALISAALRRHGRGRGKRLIQVKQQIHRFLAELLWAFGEQRAHDWGDKLWESLLKTESSEWKRIYNDAVRDKQRHLDDDPVPESVARTLSQIDLSPLAEALKQMPLRARGGQERVSERLNIARAALRGKSNCSGKSFSPNHAGGRPCWSWTKRTISRTRERRWRGSFSRGTRAALCEPAMAPWRGRSIECSS